MDTPCLSVWRLCDWKLWAGMLEQILAKILNLPQNAHQLSQALGWRKGRYQISSPEVSGVIGWGGLSDLKLYLDFGFEVLKTSPHQNWNFSWRNLIWFRVLFFCWSDKDHPFFCLSVCLYWEVGCGQIFAVIGWKCFSLIVAAKVNTKFTLWIIFFLF